MLYFWKFKINNLKITINKWGLCMTIEEKLEGTNDDIQMLSIDIGSEFIKTVSGTSYRLNSYTFFKLDTWAEEDVENIIFVHGIPYLYGAVAAERYLEELEDFNDEKISKKPVLENGLRYEFFKHSSHQLIMSEAKKIGLDLNQQILLSVSIPSRYSKKHFNDYRDHLEIFIDHDRQHVYTIDAICMPSQFGVFYEAININEKDNPLSRVLDKGYDGENKKILSINVGYSTVELVMFERKEVNGEIIFVPYGEKSISISNIGTSNMFSRNNNRESSENNSIDLLLEALEMEPDSDGLKLGNFSRSIEKNVYDFFSRILNILPENSIEIKYQDIDAVIVGGGGSIFLNSQTVKNGLSLPSELPVIFSKFPMHSSAHGMYLELKSMSDSGLFEEEE